MAATLGRIIGSFFSSINHQSFRYRRSQQDHQRHRQRHHQYNSSNNNNSSFNIHKYAMAKGRPLSLQTVELRVRMCCEGCERLVRNALLKLRGVDAVDVDLKLEKVTVTGYVDPNKVLKEVRRSGKKAEFWPNPDTPLYFTSTDDYFRDEETMFRETYNYWRHGYNGDKHGQIPVPQRGGDSVSNMFNDDDVNACSIM